MVYGTGNTQYQSSTSGQNTTNTNTSKNPIPTGSDSKTFSLKKEIISNQEAKDILLDNFNEVTISEEKFDSEKIKKIYNDLFYIIPKKGKKSHTTIIEQSTDFVYPEINENLEKGIETLNEDIMELSESSSILNTPTVIPQHPLYDNGTLLQEGNVLTNSPIEPNSTIWFMQEGMKREGRRRRKTEVQRTRKERQWQRNERNRNNTGK